MSATVVYKALVGEDLKAVMRVLHKAGLHPFAIDNVDPIVAHKSYGTYKIRVAVDEEEAGLASEVIAKWQAAAEQTVSGQSQLFIRQGVISCLVGAAISAVYFVLQEEPDFGAAAILFFFSSIGALVLISSIQARSEDKK